jgi:signal transduction histidine kinase
MARCVVQRLGDDAFLASARASQGERRLALAVAAVSFAAFCLAAPFATLPLAPLSAFIPLYQSALFINDLITAVLLLGQVRHLRSRGLLVLACGYVFDALMIVPHTLTFPGLFAPSGLLGAGSQSTAWLYMSWHGGFPLFVLGYCWLRGSPRRDRLDGPIGRRAAVAVGGVALLVVALTALATAGQALLPAIMAGNRYTPAMSVVVGTVWLLSALALIALRPRRSGSLLDLWLAVVMCAWVFDVGLSAVLNHGRFDLGFYTGRVYGLLAASFVLVMLLLESAALYAQLRRSHEQMMEMQKMEAIGKLTGGVAHDFNNLLTALIGSLDMLERTTQTSERQVALVRAAQRAALRGARLTQQLLAYGRRQTLHPELADLNGLLHEFESLVRRAVGERIELAIHPAPALSSCVVDPAQFQASLLNLALNARDAMPAGGTLTIETRHVEHRSDESSPHDWPAGSYVAVAVTDTGVGMTPEVCAHAFEPFFTTKGVGKGSGLGLSQVYGFVKQSGGHATIDSTPGQGTTITLYLPRAEAASVAPHAAASSAPAGHARNGEAVLIVEDDDDARRAVAAMLDALGYAVLTARSGREAVAILGRDQRVDLLLTDVVMPGMSGVEVANEALRLRRGIKVLLTSGYAHEVLAAHGANNNFPMVAKPYRAHELAEKLDHLLRVG